MNLPNVETTNLEGVIQITPARFGDQRGFFSETYNKATFQEIGLVCDFVQDNQSLSRQRGTVRGLHFQIAPFAQAKLVRVLRGAILDVAVDIRRASPTFGQCFAATLSAENGRQLFIPSGFAHGFCTLEPGTEVFYKVDACHSRDHERGLRWNDPALNVPWPMSDAKTLVLERDRLLPLLGELPVYF